MRAPRVNAQVQHALHPELFAAVEAHARGANARRNRALQLLAREQPLVQQRLRRGPQALRLPAANTVVCAVRVRSVRGMSM